MILFNTCPSIGELISKLESMTRISNCYTLLMRVSDRVLIFRDWLSDKHSFKFLTTGSNIKSYFFVFRRTDRTIELHHLAIIVRLSVHAFLSWYFFHFSLSVLVFLFGQLASVNLASPYSQSLADKKVTKIPASRVNNPVIMIAEAHFCMFLIF